MKSVFTKRSQLENCSAYVVCADTHVAWFSYDRWFHYVNWNRTHQTLFVRLYVRLCARSDTIVLVAVSTRQYAQRLTHSRNNRCLQQVVKFTILTNVTFKVMVHLCICQLFHLIYCTKFVIIYNIYLFEKMLLAKIISLKRYVKFEDRENAIRQYHEILYKMSGTGDTII